MSLATGSRLREAINRTKPFEVCGHGNRKKTIFKQKGGPKSYKRDEQNPALLCLALLAALLCIVAVEAIVAMQLVPAFLAPFHARTLHIWAALPKQKQHMFHSFTSKMLILHNICSIHLQVFFENM